MVARAATERLGITDRIRVTVAGWRLAGIMRRGLAEIMKGTAPFVPLSPRMLDVDPGEAVVAAPAPLDVDLPADPTVLEPGDFLDLDFGRDWDRTLPVCAMEQVQVPDPAFAYDEASQTVTLVLDR